MKSNTDGRRGNPPSASPRLVEPEVGRDACRERGITYRRRVLDPLTTLHLLLVHALHGNTSPHDLRLKAGVRATAGAICRARARLPLDFFRAVLGRSWQGTTAGVGTRLGHRELS